MKSMTKKLLVLITGVLLLAMILSSCGLDSSESNEVSDAARQEFINQMLYAEDAQILYAPQIEDEEGENPYFKQPDGYTLVSKGEGAMTGLTDMSKVLANERYELYIDFKTTDIAVLDKETRQAYHSNPSRDPDKKTNANAAKIIGSPLSVEAYDASGKRYSFNFYNNCWDNGSGAFYVVKNDDTIRLIYTIGNDPDKDLFPPVITEDTWNNRIIKSLDELLANQEITQKQYDDYGKLLKACYTYMTPKELDDEEKENFEKNIYPYVKPRAVTIDDRERFRETFPTIDVMTLYVSYAGTTSRQKKDIKVLMEQIGFTAQEVKAEMEKADYQGPERSVLYTIPVDLSLNENGLCVNIDSSMILGPTKQRLNTINVYRGFGGTSGVLDPVTSISQGYMIVPDGSGAVIKVDGNLAKDVYKGRVYGPDGSFDKEYSVDYSEQILAPYMIFDRGALPENSARMNGGGVVAILEEGAGQASVVARPVNGTASPVATINYEIVYSERDYRTYSTSFSGNMLSDDSQTGSGLLLSKDDVTGNYKIQYLFTEGGLTYSEYAAFLREYFMQKDLFPKETLKESALPFYVDLLGCVDLSQTFFGIPMQTETALTSYSQAQTILSDLKAAEVNNVVTRYSYWANGGENNTFAEDLVLVDCMGSEDELKSLVSFCETNGVGFFPSVELLYVTSTGNGFSASQDAARRMNRSMATIVERMNAIGSLREDLEEKTLLSSKVSVEIAESYKTSFEEVFSTDKKSIALGSLGQGLHSNYKTNEGVSRGLAELDHSKILATYANDGYEIAVSTGNFYTWKYASHIFGLPSGSTEYLTQDSAIPFTQMILHGYVNYSMEPVNQTGDYKTALLLTLETGSAPSFRWMGAEDSIFDYTPYYNYFSLNYKSTFDRAVALYKEAAAVLNDVVNDPITEHKELDAFFVLDHEGLIGWNDPEIDPKTGKYVTDKEGNIIITPAVERISSKGGVFATVYGDKKVVVVNYNPFDVELNDRRVVKALSYEVYTLEEYEAIQKTDAAYETRPEIQQIGEDAGQEG
ncbi:MAG: hypothetical protein J6M34_05250 [Clostridia bacterium]|nr:hypothetical protein [Clostridia bacterium]